MSRPKTYEPDSVIRLQPNGQTKLHRNSDRRAVIDLLIDEGGTCTIGFLNEKLGFDTTSIVKALVYNEWVRVEL